MLCFNHFNFNVLDLDRSLAFYKQALDLTPVREKEAELGGEGRILIRPSGTEALMRVMVEAKTEETAHTAAERLAKLIEEL